MWRDKQTKGFYLLELLVGLLLISSIYTFSYPIISGHLTGRKVKNEAHRLRIALERASLMTLQGEKDHKLVLYNNSYQIKETESSTVREKHQFKSPVYLLLSGNEEFQLNFYRSGVNTPASLAVTDGSQICKVILSLRGRVRVQC